MFDKYPYSDFHSLNLDWIISEMKQLVEDWEGFTGRVSAEAHEATEPEVTVSGDLKEGLNFDFGLVAGPRGSTGAQGPQGEPGPAGEGLQILDTYPTLADLQSAHPTGSAGDAYLVGSGGNFTLYIWSVSGSAWTDAGSLSSPSPSNVAPAMNGTASAGSSALYSRGDHVHPSDATKLDKSATNGVYAVSGGAQVMRTVSDNAAPDAITAYDSVGDLNTVDLNASGDVNAVNGSFSGDVDVTGDISGSAISGDTITIANNTILNSQMLAAEASTNAYRPMATINPIDPLALSYDIATNIPSIKFNAVSYDQSGTRTTLAPEVKFTDSFKVNTADYAETRIGMSPASASTLGGVKIGSGLNVAADGTLSTQGSGGYSLDLVWTNPSPTSDFAGQTVSIDLSQYGGYMIVVFKATTTASLYVNDICLLPGMDWEISHLVENSIKNRTVSYNDNGVTFSDCKSRTTVTGGTLQNSGLIPYEIYIVSIG